MNETQTFSAWIKRRRKALDLTQQELADQVGCSASALIKIEAGVRRPSRQIAERLAVCLAIPAADQPAFLHLARAVPAAAAESPPTNLPASLTSLVGREEEMAQVQALLRGPARLVTLIGPGG